MACAQGGKVVSRVGVWLKVSLVMALQGSDASGAHPRSPPIENSWAAAIALLFGAILVLARIHTHYSVNTVTSVDLFVFLDVVDRIAHGQTPHVDFYCSLGDAFTYALWLGDQVQNRIGIELFLAVELIYLLAVAVPFYVIAKCGLKIPAGIVLFIVIVLCILTTVQEFSVHSPINYTEAGIYNRLSAAALLALSAIAIGRFEPRTRRAVLIVGAAAAWLLLLLLCTKISYFAAGLMLILLSAVLNRSSRSQVAIALALFCGAVLLSGLIFPRQAF